MATDPQLAQQMVRFQKCVETRDVVMAEDVLDDDYALMLMHPVAALNPRARWLELLPDYLIHTYDVHEVVVDDDGEGCAAVFQRVTMHATVLGEDRSGEIVITDIWRKRADAWRLWRRHSTPLTAGPLPGIEPLASTT